MIQKTAILLSLFLIGSYSLDAQVKKRIKYYELDINNNLFYQPNTFDPYTGTAYDEHSNAKKKIEVPIKDGKIHGIIREWEKNGQKIYEAKYENGVQVDREQQWYATGVKSLELGYMNGKAEGMCLEWHKNGKRKSEGLFQNGKEEGEHNWWYANGKQDQKSNYANGLQEGMVQNWHKNGELKLETSYKKGLRDGPVTEWHGNGEKKMEAYYTDDLADKEHKFWSKRGLMLGKQKYDKGKLIQDYNYRSGNIRTSRGFIQIFNQKESFYKVNVKGSTVNVIKDPLHILYNVDGMLLRLYDIPLDSIDTKGLSADEELLNKFVETEQAIFQKEAGDFRIDVKSEKGKIKSGIPYLYWHFQSPSSQDEEQKPRTAQSEHYISFICNKQILNLYSVVTNSDEPKAVESMLKRMAEQVEKMEERIDLNAIAKSIR